MSLPSNGVPSSRSGAYACYFSRDPVSPSPHSRVSFPKLQSDALRLQGPLSRCRGVAPCKPLVELSAVVAGGAGREVVFGDSFPCGNLLERLGRPAPEVLGGLLGGHPLG